MATIVLVHGAMHGGWVWERLAPLLRRAGHVVYMPTLTGQGDRADELTRHVSLQTHVADLISLHERHALEDTWVVPHSYGGVVADVLAEASPRVGHIVRVDAFLLADREALMDIEPPATRDFYRRWADEQGDGWRLKPDVAFLAQWGITSPDEVAFVSPRLTDFPLRCLTDVAALPTARGRAITEGVIWHTQPALAGLSLSRQRASAEGWPVAEIKAGHDAMVSQPRELARALLDLIAQVRCSRCTGR